MRTPAVTAGVWALLPVFGTVAASGQGSLADLDIEFAEASVSLQSVTEENARMRDRTKQMEQTIKSLTEGIAIANSEAEVFRRECGQLQLRLEALGLEGGGSDESKLQQRLLKAVSDLRLVKEERDKLAERLLAVNETLVRFLKIAEVSDPQVRLDLEAELRSANETLGGTPGGSIEAAAVPATLTDAMVISVKEDLSLVVANVGARQGVKMGMPFQVVRKDVTIGTVRVIDVRERIAGAVIQDLGSEKEKIRVGDRLRVAVNK